MVGADFKVPRRFVRRFAQIIQLVKVRKKKNYEKRREFNFVYFGRLHLVCQIKLETPGTKAIRMQTKFLIVYSSF